MLSPFLIPFSILLRRPGLVFLFLDDFCLVHLVDTLLDLRLDAWLVLLVVVSEVRLGMLVIVDSFDFVDFFELFDAWVVSSECGVFAVSVDRGVLVLLGPRVSLVTVDLDPPPRNRRGDGFTNVGIVGTCCCTKHLNLFLIFCGPTAVTGSAAAALDGRRVEIGTKFVRLFLVIREVFEVGIRIWCGKLGVLLTFVLSNAF